MPRPAHRSAALAALAVGLLPTALPAPAIAADAPAPEVTFQFRPAQKGADIDTPPKAEWPQCQVKVEREGKVSGWVVYGPQGQVLRRFLDTDGDNVVDQWRYYKNGLEAYRDIDTNANNKVDQSRWLNTGGTRWGLDPDEDGKINSWKTLSAEEASRVAVEAMIRGDVAELQGVLITAEDLKKLGVTADVAKSLMENVADVAGQLRAVAGSKVLSRGTTWLRFDSSSPGVVPADAGQADRDLYVYENAMAIVDVGGQPGLVQVGEMVRVGDVWKLTQVPKPIDGDSVQIAAGGVLMQPQMVLPDAAMAGGINPKMRALLEDLQKLDAASPQPSDGPQAFATYNAKRAEVLAGLVKAADAPEEKDQWTRQLADSVAAAVQTGVYPDGMVRLETLDRELVSAKASPELLGYVRYRRLVADYSRRLRDADSEGRVEVQKWWLTQLKEFSETYPALPEASDALLQLAVSEEFAGNTAEATAWYQKLARAFPETDPGRRAAGALTRLGLKGQPLQFSIAGLKGGTLSSNDLRGKVALVLFWSTWCKPCGDDLPAIRALYEKHHGQGFEIIGVNLDQTAEPVEPYLAKHQMTWPQAHEPGGLESKPALDFGIISLPTMILVGRDGKVVSRGVSVDDLKTSLPELLGGGV